VIFFPSIKAISLAIASTVPIVEKHGLSKVLELFVTDMNILATTGIDITYNGKTKNYKGTLLTFLADNLASNNLGGFKKSFFISILSSLHGDQQFIVIQLWI